VIDTVGSRHPDLRGRIAEERNFVDDDATVPVPGTAVAGVIAAVANNHVACQHRRA
jgi:hypothetical protein